MLKLEGRWRFLDESREAGPHDPLHWSLISLLAPASLHTQTHTHTHTDVVFPGPATDPRILAGIVAPTLNRAATAGVPVPS